MNTAIIGIVIVLVLSASMSTLSSLVLTSGSTVTLDFIAPLRKKKASEKGNMLLIRIFIAIFIIISAVIAIYQAKSPKVPIGCLPAISKFPPWNLKIRWANKKMPQNLPYFFFHSIKMCVRI